MAYRDEYELNPFYDGCIRAYGAATRLMTEVWEDVVGEPMGKLSGSPKVRFRKALSVYEEAIRKGTGTSLTRDLRQAAATDEVLRSLIDESFEEPDASLRVDVDDGPPTVFKDAIRDEANDRAGDDVVDVNLEVFLRAVVARVVPRMGWNRRLNVGENRHFPRMVQWLREVQTETTDGDCIGLKLMNRSARGPVATYPISPRTLMVRLDARWL